MMATFRNRNFSLLWLAGLVSLMGNWMLMAALPFHIYAVTGSALATSAWLMAYILPGVLFGSVTGVFVDRWDRRKTMIADAILSAVLVVFVQGVAGATATEFGWMLTARGVGGLIGGLLIARVGQKLTAQQLTAWGLITSAVILFIVLLKPTTLVLLIGMGVAGLQAIAWIVGLQTLLQQATVDEYRGRVFGTFGTTASLVMLIGSGLAGLTADLIGASVLLVIAAVFLCVAGVLGGLFLGASVAKSTESVATAVS